MVNMNGESGINGDKWIIEKIMFNPRTVTEVTCIFVIQLIFSLAVLISFLYLHFCSSSAYLRLSPSSAVSPMMASVPHVPSGSFFFLPFLDSALLGPCIFLHSVKYSTSCKVYPFSIYAI